MQLTSLNYEFNQYQLVLKFLAFRIAWSCLIPTFCRICIGQPFLLLKIFHFSVLPGENIDASHLSHPLLSRGLEGSGAHIQGRHRFIFEPDSNDETNQWQQWWNKSIICPGHSKILISWLYFLLFLSFSSQYPFNLRISVTYVYPGSVVNAEESSIKNGKIPKYLKIVSKNWILEFP